MVEIELKFQVPAGAEAAVRRAVGTAQARQQRLRARYLDTPDHRLARSRAALRLRDEGAHWVQTFKAEGDNPMQRLEHEVELPGGEPPPDPDLARHANTPAAEALARALGMTVLAGDGRAQGLALHFETDIQRLSRVVRLPGGTRVELAFDVGVIRAGAGNGRCASWSSNWCRASPPTCWRWRSAGWNATACGWTCAARPNEATCWRPGAGPHRRRVARRRRCATANGPSAPCRL